MSPSSQTLQSIPNLQIELHAATRVQHTTLNQSITARLPLCLPPHTSNTTTYSNGIRLFGSIFVAFEDAWDRGVRKGKVDSDDGRYQEMLRRLQTPGLRRTEVLRQDYATLGLRPTSTQADRITLASHAFGNRVRHAISAKPHVTLAYAWTMYLALFNGGRWLLGQLSRPGPEFWAQNDTLEAKKSDALSFWRFDHSNQPNGEDIKAAFKANFDSAASLLTDTERDDVIAECKAIFDMCAEMVTWLDQHEQEAGLAAWFKPATRIWQTLSSTAAAYLAPSMPKPLREELKPVEA